MSVLALVVLEDQPAESEDPQAHADGDQPPLPERDDPWGWGRSLEWATSCPPPRHNFHSIPRIRSESPAFDLHHPEVAAIELAANEAAREGRFADAPEMEGREEMLEERGAVVTDERPDDDDQTGSSAGDQDGETR